MHLILWCSMLIQVSSHCELTNSNFTLYIMHYNYLCSTRMEIYYLAVKQLSKTGKFKKTK